VTLLGTGTPIPLPDGFGPSTLVIAHYMAQLETAEHHGDAVPEAKVARLKDKIAKLKEEITRLNAIYADMMKSEDKQISLTDPDV
jgi:hypothetical protein